MPSAIKYLPPTDPERSIFNRPIREERTARKTVYLDALKYYFGKHDPPLEVYEEDDNIILNLVKVTCDRTTQFLFPQMPIFETDPESIEDTPEEVFLRDAYEDNGGLATLVKMAMRGFLSGHVFVRVKPPSFGSDYPRIISLDPLAITIYWSVEEEGRVLWYENRYTVGNQVYVEDYVIQQDGTWRIYTFRQSDRIQDTIFVPSDSHGRATRSIDFSDFSEGNFVLVDEGFHTSQIPPVVEWAHLPNPNSRYGLSEFSDKSLQDKINSVASRAHIIVAENANPKDVFFGVDAREVQNDGDLITVANPLAKGQRFEMKGDMPAIHTLLEVLIKQYLALKRVVLLEGEAESLQRVTNAAVRTLFLDALAKNEILISTYGGGLSKVSTLVLQMGYAGGQVDRLGYRVRTVFSTPLPNDNTEIANVNALAITGGYMSRQTAAERLSLNYGFEKANIEQDQAEDLVQMESRMEVEARQQPENDVDSNVT